MGNPSCQRALETAKQRLVSIPNSSGLRCLLIDKIGIRPPEVPPPQCLDHMFPRCSPGSFHAFGYRELAQIYRMDGSPECNDTPTLDVTGKPIAFRNGTYPAFLPPVNRTFYLYNNRSALLQFGSVAKGLGMIGEYPPEPSQFIAPESLCIGKPDRRWLCVLFDLAWAAGTSQLRNATFEAHKSVYIPEKDVKSCTLTLGNSNIPINPGISCRVEEIARLRQDAAQSHPPFPGLDWDSVTDPPSWYYSVLEDVVGASIGAVDLLVTHATEKPEAAASGTGQGGETQPVVPKRPSDNAFKAWRLRDLTGLKTQREIAGVMSEQLGRTVHQGEVSKWLRDVDAYRRAGGVFPDLPGLSGEPQSIDPAVIDMGKRRDHLTPRQRQRRDPDAD